MEALGRRSSRKGEKKVGSGSKKQQHRPLPQAQNLPKAAISRRDNRKRVFEERRKEKDNQAKQAQVGKQAWSLSLEKAKAPADEGLGKKTAERQERPDLSIFGGDMQEILGMTMDDDAWAEWLAAFEDEDPPTIIPDADKGKKKESIEEREMRMRAQLKGEDLSSDESDEANRARCFRDDWESLWSRRYGAFEDNTRIPSMRFTWNRASSWDAMYESALQIFSAKVTTTRTGDLPFDVFGVVAVRDTIDYNRNIVFSRTRDNCQTLSKEHPDLVLTGPTRAVFLEQSPSHVIIEVDLTLKGTTDSEDEKLSSLVVPIVAGSNMYSHMWESAYTSKLSTVEFRLGHIVSSVEATIFVRVTRGSWPDGFRGRFYAIASGECPNLPNTAYHTDVNDEKIVLLDAGGDDKVSVTSEGNIELSRRVVSVDTGGELKVYVEAWGGGTSLCQSKSFKPLDAGKGSDDIDMGFCAMDVTVFWSLISHRHFYSDSVL